MNLINKYEKCFPNNIGRDIKMLKTTTLADSRYCQNGKRKKKKKPDKLGLKDFMV